MKPPQTGDGGWGIEMKQEIEDKPREAYNSASTSLIDLIQKACDPRKSKKTYRQSSFEDPIRRMMFLGPWSHT